MISHKKISGFANLKFLKGIKLRENDKKKKREKHEVSALKALLFSPFYQINAHITLIMKQDRMITIV